jgi:transposase
MLRRAGDGRQLDFADFTQAARSVPEDHWLLRIRALQTDAELDRIFEDTYDPANGRPSYPPSQMFRISQLQFLFNLSDEAVVEQVGFNLLYRQFVGLGWNDSVPDPSVLSRFRTRVGPERVKRVLDQLGGKAREIGLLDDRRRVVDGTHILAKIVERSRRELYADGRDFVLEAVRQKDCALAAALEKKFPPVTSKECGSKDGRLRRERARTRKFLEHVWKKRTRLGAEVIRRSRLLRRVALQGNPDQINSFDDQDARFGHKTKDWTFTGYKAHEEIDPKSRLITALHVIPGNEIEPTRIGELLDREAGGLPRGAAVIGDAAYTSEPCHRAIRDRGGLPVSPRMKTIRQVEKFKYDASTDRLVCMAGKASFGKTRTASGDLYYFSVNDCSACPRQQDCLRRSELKLTKPRARVWVSDTIKPKLAAGELGSEFRSRCYAERYKIEAVFGEQKGPRSELGFARYWGLAKVEVQALLTAIATNALRIVRWLAKRSSMEVPKPLPLVA